jgi:hypothetical protein
MKPAITILNPPELGFFSKQISYNGIPIKASAVVSDEALYVAFDRLSMMLSNMPVVVSNLVAAKVELHIIGQNQVTTDLPEWRQDKGKPLPEYNGAGHGREVNFLWRREFAQAAKGALLWSRHLCA